MYTNVSTQNEGYVHVNMAVYMYILYIERNKPMSPYKYLYRCYRWPTSFPLHTLPWFYTYGHFPLPCPSLRTTSSWAILSWPLYDAECNGVNPSFFFACTSALFACDAPIPTHPITPHHTRTSRHTNIQPFICMHICIQVSL